MLLSCPRPGLPGALRAVLAVALLALTPGPAAAGTYGAAPPDRIAQVDVLQGWAEAGTHVAAIRIRLAPGWKTYWRAPGEAGIPPSFDWKDSTNLTALRFHWPVPHVFETNGMRSIGYRDQVVLPIFLTPRRADRPIHLDGVLDLGVCLDVCVPLRATIAVDIPPGGARDPRIVAALADRARTGAEAGLSSQSCTLDPIADGLRLTARLGLPPQGKDEFVVIETATPGVWVSEASVSRRGGELLAGADLVPPAGKPFALDRSSLRITVIGQDRAVDIAGCPGK